MNNHSHDSFMVATLEKEIDMDLIISAVVDTFYSEWDIRVEDMTNESISKFLNKFGEEFHRQFDH